MAPTVLVVKLAAIGDVAMALPMVTALRAQHPRCHITWLCGQSVEPLLQCVEGIDEIVVADERALLAGSRRKQTAAVLKIWRRLAGQRFDLTVTAHSDRRYLWLTLPIRAGIRRQFHDGLGTSRSGRGRYYGDEYVRLVTDIDDYRATRYLPPRINVALSAKLLALLSGHNIGAQPLIALAPGGARNAARDSPLRRWPLERYVSIARSLVNLGMKVAITGSDEDYWVREAFCDSDVIDLVGHTTLPQLIALYRECAAVVTHDSGPLHLARLAHASLVALFGPTLPASFVPRDDRTVVVWPGMDLPCCPCYDGKEFASCANNLCMQMIAPSVVVDAVVGLIERTRIPRNH